MKLVESITAGGGNVVVSLHFALCKIPPMLYIKIEDQAWNHGWNSVQKMPYCLPYSPSVISQVWYLKIKANRRKTQEHSTHSMYIMCFGLQL